MTKFLIYFFPAIMDMLFGTVFFVCPMRLAASGASATLASGIIVAWAVPYIITNHFLGRWVTTRNAEKMLLWSSLALAVDALCFIIFPAPMLQYLWTVVTGVGGAFFFAPFQTFMKGFESGSAGVVRSTGLYTFSWSFGLACGPFISGPLWEKFGWQYCHLLNVLIGIICFAGIYLLGKMRHSAHKHGDTAGAAQELSAYAHMRDLVWLGWIGSGVGCFVVSIIRGVFPKTATEYGVAVAGSGLALALVSFSQSFTGLIFCFSRTWMYKPLPVGLLGGCGVISSLLFGFGSTTLSYCIAAILFGIYSGGFFFYLVFHALVHPSKSAHYISINEMVVGLGGICGPVVGGILSDKIGLGMPYYFSAVLIAGAVLLQVIVHSQKDDAKNYGRS